MRSKFLFLLLAFIVIATQDSYSQWTFAGSVTGAGTFPSISVVDQNTVWIGGGPNGVPAIFLSTNGGANFTAVGTSGLLLEMYCVWGRSNTTAFTGNGGASGGAGGNAQFFRTTNVGANWTSMGATGGSAGFINGIVFSKTFPNFGVVQSDPPTGSGQAYYIAKSTDGGATWTVTNPPGLSGAASAQNSIVVIDSLFYGFGTNAGASRVYFTSNGGANWTVGTLGLTGAFVSGFAMNSNKLTGIAVTSTSLPTVARTTNGGATWTSVNTGAGATGAATVNWIPGTNTVYLAGNTGATNVIKKSTDGGVTWTGMTTAGLTGITHMEFARVGNTVYGYAVAADGSVLKITDVVTGVHDPVSEIPSEYSLQQNYPNPFNPATTIKFSIPTSSHVTLKVYNSIGKEVATILSDYRTAGTYSEQFVASTNLSSGIYFYTLSAGSFKDTKKFMLVK